MSSWLARCALVAAAVLVLSGGPVHAQRTYIATTSETTVVAGVVAEIARRPNDTEAIISDAVRRHPEYSEVIVSRTSAAFPGFASRIERAAAIQGAPGRNAGPVDAVAAPTSADAVRESEMGSPWSGELAVGGSRSTGNTETAEVNIDAGLKYREARWTHLLDTRFDLSQDQNTTTEQSLEVDAETRYDLTRRIFTFGLIEYRDEKFSGFDYEVAEIAGLGYRLFDTETFKLSLTAGGGARQSKLSETGETVNRAVGRIGSDLEWALSPTSEITNRLSVKIDRDRVLTENIVALTTDLVGSLDARISFEVAHNSDPPPNTKDIDTETQVAIVYRFNE